MKGVCRVDERLLGWRLGCGMWGWLERAGSDWLLEALTSFWWKVTFGLSRGFYEISSEPVCKYPLYRNCSICKVIMKFLRGVCNDCKSGCREELKRLSIAADHCFCIS
jgi:hypothetical protein